MKKKARPISSRILSTIFFGIASFSVSTVLSEIISLSVIHTIPRYFDLLLRASSVVLFFIASFQLWKSKKHAYTTAIIACILRIALYILVLVEIKQYAAEDSGYISIAIFIVIIVYMFYLQRKSYR